MNRSDMAGVGFIGLGAMGFGMATNLLNHPQYAVTGFDVYTPKMDEFRERGGATAASPREVGRRSNFLICMAANSKQVHEILFNDVLGALSVLPNNAIVLVCSTVSPAFHAEVAQQIVDFGRPDVHVLDCPVSGGTKRAAEGSLSIFASGNTAVLARADEILKSMSEVLNIVPGGAGAASKIKMVNQLLVGVHIAAAAEIMAIAAKAGLNTRQMYDLLVKSSGNSWAFENRVPHMLEGDWTPHSAVDIFVKDMGIVIDSAREIQCSLPISSTVEQIYTFASSQGYGREDDAGVVRVYLPGMRDAVARQANVTEQGSISMAGSGTATIAVLGAGAASHHTAANLLREGYDVSWYDTQTGIPPPGDDGIMTMATSAQNAARGAEVLIISESNASRLKSLLFGPESVLIGVEDGAIILINSDGLHTPLQEIQAELLKLKRQIGLVDYTLFSSAGPKSSHQLLYSGSEQSIAKAGSLVSSLTSGQVQFQHIHGPFGSATFAKLLVSMSIDVHVATAAEAFVFAHKLGLDLESVFTFLKSAAAWSWQFERVGLQVLNGGLGSIGQLFHADFLVSVEAGLKEARRLLCYSPILATAHAYSVAHPYLKVPQPGPNPAILPRSHEGSLMPIPLRETLSGLPPENTFDSVRQIQEVLSSGSVPTLVVLDDDPTGTQTCHNIHVLTAWDEDTLDTEFSLGSPGFFILTNSRALPSAQARELVTQITTRVKEAAARANLRVEIVLRGDSTLRGHLPEEPEAVEDVLGAFDAWILAPAFFQGGRFTINDVQYVKEDAMLVPAGQTPFAEDATFGYKNSNLRQYVMEKCGPRFDEAAFISITLADIRRGGPESVARKLLSIKAGQKAVVTVNAAAESDMFTFVAGLLEATKTGKRYLYRTGAAFVSARLGIRGIPPLTLAELDLTPEQKQAGGLTIAGSYVPKTTAQLQQLKDDRGEKLVVIELDVVELIGSPQSAACAIRQAAENASAAIARGNDVLVMTSRVLIKTHDSMNPLEVGAKIAGALVQIIRSISVRPRYFIAKGGITSSDGAVKGLLMRRATILGQAAPGVPLWRCTEETSRFPGVPYVVFPGNVGDETTLAKLVKDWSLDQ